MLVGHKKQRQYLKSSVSTGKLPHALLFAGEKGLGKRTVALELSKLLNCQSVNPDRRPCQSCRSCRDIQKNQYPDLTIVEPEKKEIQIGQIRDLIWRLSLRPYNSPLKIAIIDGAHLMNTVSQNCLLKTLEEPKGDTLLVLASEQPQMLLGTILSRTERINFYPVALQEIEKHLVSQGASLALARELAALSSGKPARAIDFFLNPQRHKDYKTRLAEVAKLPSLDYVERFQYAKGVSEEPAETGKILEIFLSHFRNVLFSALSKKENVAVAKTVKIIKAIERTLYLVSSTNINVRLALEVLMLEL